MKTLLTVILLTLPCFAQQDIQVGLTNASVSVWNRRRESGEPRKPNQNVKDMQLTFTMRISTNEKRAYPVDVEAYVLVEKKDGSRKWKDLEHQHMSGFKWTSRDQEVNAKEVNGNHKITAGIRDVDGKIIAWSIKATSRLEPRKFNSPVFFEWKDKNAKGIKNAPFIGSNLEDKL